MQNPYENLTHPDYLKPLKKRGLKYEPENIPGDNWNCPQQETSEEERAEQQP